MKNGILFHLTFLQILKIIHKRVERSQGTIESTKDI